MEITSGRGVRAGLVKEKVDRVKAGESRRIIRRMAAKILEVAVAVAVVTN